MAIRPQRVQKPLRELRKSLRKLSPDPPPEEVHALRTLTRRVEAIAAAWEHGDGKLQQRLLRSIQPIRRAAGRVRDMDVLAANVLGLPQSSASLARLVENLRSARRAYANALLRAAGRHRKAACHAVKQYSRLVRPAFAGNKSSLSAGARASQAENAIHSAATKRMSALSRWPALDESNLHDFRLKIKELRSILQLFADSDRGLVEALGGANTRIGDWHDWQQLKEIAEGIPGEPLDRALLAQIGRTVKSKLRLALAACDALRKTYLHSIPRRAKAA
jgi:CHAD domain-containing protein